MSWLRITVELVTPCFLGGAAGAKDPSRKWDELPENQQRAQERGQLLRQANSRETPEYEQRRLKQEAKQIESEGKWFEKSTRDTDDPIAELLRPASLIGHWRFWLRALLGASYGGDARRVADRESVLFGSASGSEKDSAQGIVHVRPGTTALDEFRVVRLKSRPTLDSLKSTSYKSFGRVDPLAYLGYGLIDVPHERALERPAIRAGTTLDVELRVRARRRARQGPRPPEAIRAEERDAWRDLRHALWLWQTFGGVGARSRRGWGSVQIAPLEDLSALEAHPDEAEAWRSWFESPSTTLTDRLGAILDTAPTALGAAACHAGATDLLGARADALSNAASHQARFSHFGSFLAVDRAVVADSWEQALAWLGHDMLVVRSNDQKRPDGNRRDVRTLRWQDHDLVHDVLRRSAPNPQARSPHRAAFGLPHNYFFSTDQPKEGPEIEAAADRKKRRASPVLLHVARVDGKYVGRILWFKADLAPGGIQSIMKDRGRPLHVHRFSAPDWGAVVEFLDTYVTPAANPGAPGSSPPRSTVAPTPAAASQPLTPATLPIPQVNREFPDVPLERDDRGWFVTLNGQRFEVPETRLIPGAEPGRRCTAKVSESSPKKQRFFARVERWSK